MHTGSAAPRRAPQRSAPLRSDPERSAAPRSRFLTCSLLCWLFHLRPCSLAPPVRGRARKQARKKSKSIEQQKQDSRHASRRMENKIYRPSKHANQYASKPSSKQSSQQASERCPHRSAALRSAPERPRTNVDSVPARPGVVCWLKLHLETPSLFKEHDPLLVFLSQPLRIVRASSS